MLSMNIIRVFTFSLGILKNLIIFFLTCTPFFPQEMGDQLSAYLYYVLLFIHESSLYFMSKIALKEIYKRHSDPFCKNSSTITYQLKYFDGKQGLPNHIVSPFPWDSKLQLPCFDITAFTIIMKSVLVSTASKGKKEEYNTKLYFVLYLSFFLNTLLESI